jgi:hypothetical protein
MSSMRSRHPLLRLALALAALGLLALPLAGTAAADDLEGQIRVQPGPLHAPGPQLFAARDGVPVTLIDANTGRLIGHVFTDPLGRYIFHDVPAGSYKVIVGYPSPVQQQIITAPGGFAQSVPPIIVPGSR